jgi:hypothetical protein
MDAAKVVGDFALVFNSGYTFARLKINDAW